jgi:hypothetical protein
LTEKPDIVGKQSPAREFWSDKIREFIDAREFFRQRSEILKTPELMLNPPTKEPDKWSSPITFALQSILLQLLVFSALSQVFEYCPRTTQSLFKLSRATPELEIERIFSNQKKQLDETTLVIVEVKRSPPTAVFFFAPYTNRLVKDDVLSPAFDDSPHDRDEFVRLLEDIKSAQSDQFVIARSLLHLQHSIDQLAKEWGGLVIVLMSEVFRRLVCFGRFKATREVDRADSFFLYYFSAITFPMFMILKLVGGLQLQLQRYGAPTAYLYSAGTILLLVGAVGWSYALWHSVPTLIKLLGFGGDAAPTKGVRFKVAFDVFATVIISQVLAVLALFLAFLSLDTLQSWLLSLKL